MNHIQQFAKPVFIFLFAAGSFSVKAQDTIIKNNGDFIFAKVLEIGTNGVSYKRHGFEDGPTFVEPKTEMLAIKFQNGSKEVFAKATNGSPQQNNSSPLNSNSQGNNNIQNQMNSQQSSFSQNRQSNDPLKNGPVSNQYRIDNMNGKFKINGEKASSKDVDHLLSSSKNPAVQVMAKTAKASKTLQKVIGYTSIPTTIGGGVSTAVTMVNMFKSMAQTGGASINEIMGMGTSLLGTITMPITNKILKNRRDKLYYKAIDLYNMSN